jgi:hypothetical protein
VLDSQKRGFSFFRHSAGHSDEVFPRMNWLWNFRLDQSYPVFTNRSGYGLGPDQNTFPDDFFLPFFSISYGVYMWPPNIRHFRSLNSTIWDLFGLVINTRMVPTMRI